MDEPRDDRGFNGFEESYFTPTLPVPRDEAGPGPGRGQCPVVGIGASAGGLEAFTQMLRQLPTSTGMGFVLVQHLDPNHESILAELLQNDTAMPVEQATQGSTVKPNHIYVIPPNTRMAIRNGVLMLTPRSDDHGRNLPIDFFLCSLAENEGSRSIGVILSGAASDGSVGLEAIKASGGITFAQDDSAKFDSMPRSAIASGVVDFVLPPNEIAHELGVISDHFHFGIHKTNPVVEDGPMLQKVLALLQRQMGVNFTHYKLPTIARRLSRRMALNHVDQLSSYLEILDQRPAEVAALFDDVLITVTEFFRDPATFEALMESAFPTILKQRGSDEPVRVWVAGCATGKEVYSLAICLTEYMERTHQSFPIQIFGTDVSERAIDVARQGKYPKTIFASVSSSRLDRFFIKLEDGYQITSSIREQCLFSRHDITRDPPLARMDLISCRNLLIYLGPVLQRRLLAVFSYALRSRGFLLLGNSESPGPLSEHFITLDAKHKIYKRNLDLPRPSFEATLRMRLANQPGRTAAENSAPEKAAPEREEASKLSRLADRILIDEYAPSGFLVDSSQRIVKFLGSVGPYLAPPTGEPDLSIFKLVREDLAAPLRTLLEEAGSSDRLVRRDRISMRQGGGFHDINLVIRPVPDVSVERHYLVLFEEVSQHSHPAPFSPVPGSQVAGSQGYGNGGPEDYLDVALELSATRGYMQRLVEELRGANEEAQSGNEELQSANQDLQTAKEELQSTNEELNTTNEEMQSRNRELGHINNDLVNLLSSLQVPIVMLNNDLRIRRYTPVAEKVLNLIPTDIGRPISDLKPRINVPDMEELIGHVISTNQPTTREVSDQDGRWYSMRVHPYRTAERRVEGAVLQLLDIDQLKRSIEAVQEARDYAEAVIETIREPLLVLDHELRVLTANRAFYEMFGRTPEQTTGQNIYSLDDAQWRLPQVTDLFDRLAQKHSGPVQETEIESHFPRLGWRTFQLSARCLHRDGKDDLILLAMDDVSNRKRAAEAKYRRLFETAKDGMVIISAQTGEITDVNPFVVELLGYTREEMVGRAFWDVEPFRNVEGGKIFLDRLNAEKVVRIGDLPLKTRDSRTVDVEIIANVYQDGDVCVAQLNIRDSTERKHFDQQLQQTARLESLGVLAGGIAHDFNNLLAGILGNAGLALSDAPAGGLHQAALRDVIQASKQAAELTRQMLAYAGKGRLLVRPLDLSDFVRDIVILVRSSIARSIELDLKLAENLPMVQADSTQMQQVIMNLVINGAESIGEGGKGRVAVSTSTAYLDAGYLDSNFHAVNLAAGHYVVLEVTDTGSGMDERTQSRIFDPFFTTKFTGRGLGLASVRGILRGHGGAIRVRSSLGNGTTFQVVLPVVSAPREKIPIQAEAVDLQGEGTILVVDDEPIVLSTSTAILSRHGYQPITACNGEQAVEIVRSRKDELSLVILDLTMPVMGGQEALKLIKELAPDLPVVLSSGYDVSEAGELNEDTVAGFIHKPATVTSFLETVKSAKRERL